MSGGLIFFIGFAGLAGFGVLFYIGWTMLKEEQGKKDTYNFGNTPAPARPAPEAKSSGSSWLSFLDSPKPATASADATANEVLRLMRDKLTGRLVVEMNGQRYARLADITDPTLREAFEATLGDLHTFVGGRLTLPTVPTATLPPPAPLTSAPPAPVYAAPSESVSFAPPPVTPAPPPAVRPSAPPLVAPEPELRVPSMNPFKQMQVLRDMEKAQPTQPKTITEQIDEILQEKVQASPYAQRGVRMHAGPKGNALFTLDGRSYEAVDDVPDAQVRELIRKSVSEWEKKK